MPAAWLSWRFPGEGAWGRTCLLFGEAPAAPRLRYSAFPGKFQSLGAVEGGCPLLSLKFFWLNPLRKQPQRGSAGGCGAESTPRAATLGVLRSDTA